VDCSGKDVSRNVLFIYVHRVIENGVRCSCIKCVFLLFFVVARVEVDSFDIVGVKFSEKFKSFAVVMQWFS